MGVLFLAVGLGAGWFLGGGAASAPEVPAPAVTNPEQAVSVTEKKSQVESLSIPALDEWTDRYADGKEGDVRFFNLTRLMKTYDLTRLQAVEVQNTYRDLTRATPGAKGDDVLKQAVETVKSGKLESGIDAKALAEAPFIVVFDLDETLYDQYYSGGESCHQFKYEQPNGKMKYIQTAPGWDKTIKGIVELGGKVVIFSANLDDRTIRNLQHMTLDGVPLTESKYISGVMTNSHLIQQEKTEPPGSAQKPRKGRPVLEPSKDLRHFDPSLERVIIVDDNPLRLFQYRNTRIFKKFHADEYCTTKDADLHMGWNKAMEAVLNEVKSSVNYMKLKPGTTFVQAYLPFTQLGRITLDFLMDAHDWDRARAIDHIRSAPESVDTRF